MTAPELTTSPINSTTSSSTTQSTSLSINSSSSSTNPPTEPNASSWQGRSVIRETNVNNRAFAVQNALTQVFAYIFEFIENVCDYLQLNPERIRLSQQYGAGIRNGGNSCYFNSVLQAIRFSTNLRTLPPGTPEITAIRNDLITAFDVIEGRVEQTRTLSINEINLIRDNMINRGLAVAPFSQEDAAQFSEFILDGIGLPPFDIVTKIAHQHGNDIHARENNNHIIYLPITTTEKKQKLQDLISENTINESRERVSSSQEVRATLPETVPTLHTTALVDGNFPELLPICLKRYTFDVANGVPQKVYSHVEPSQEIEVPIAGDPNRTAVYELYALVAHEGNRPQSGHYTSYISQNVEGNTAWVEYNSSAIHLYQHPQQDLKNRNETVFEMASKNGYLFFYRFKHVK